MAYNVIFKILGLSEELTSKNKRRKQDFRSSNSFKYGRSNLSLTQTPILYCAIYYIEVHIYIILSHYFCTESVAPSWHQDAFTLSFSAPVSCLSCAQLCSVAHPCTGAARETQRGRRRARTFVWKCSRVNSNTAENRGAKGGKGVRRTASGKPLEAAAVFFSGRGERLVLEFGAISSHLLHCGRPPGTKAKCCLELIARSDSSHTAGLPSPLGKTRFCT